MPKFASLFVSAAFGRGGSEHWGTPTDLYEMLNAEFLFTLDPCPLSRQPTVNGLTRSWTGERVFCNPPYGPGIAKWLAKAREAAIAVFLVPSRTDTKWWHEYAMTATEIRFIKGRLRFGGVKTPAPFPSVVLIYSPTRSETEAGE